MVNSSSVLDFEHLEQSFKYFVMYCLSIRRRGTETLSTLLRVVLNKKPLVSAA